MADRVKYPLTEEAKATARDLALKWQQDEIDQLFQFVEFTGDDRVQSTMGLGVYSGKRVTSPPRNVLIELARFGLLEMRHVHEHSWDVLLLQELRNAVENEFEVSDYFLTTSTIGTVINLGAGASVSGIQSIAINYGSAIQNVEQLADKLTETLGADLLSEQKALHQAIDSLRSAEGRDDTHSKLGHVIDHLWQSVGHVGTAGSAIAAIQVISQLLPQILR